MISTCPIAGKARKRRHCCCQRTKLRLSLWQHTALPGGGPPPEQPVQLPAGSPGALCGLFLAACSAEALKPRSDDQGCFFVWVFFPEMAGAWYFSQLFPGCLQRNRSTAAAAAFFQRGGTQLLDLPLPNWSHGQVIEAKQAAEGFTRSEQECKNPADGVGWLALARQPKDLPLEGEIPVAIIDHYPTRERETHTCNDLI